MKLRYLRKWSRMPWWSQMHLLKQRNKLVHDQMYALIAPHLGNMEELREKYNRHTINNEKGRENDYFVKTFLRKYPEFKYAEVGDMDMVDARSTNVGRLIQHFKRLVKNGMSEKAAFEMIEDKYQDHLDNKRRNLNIANNLKVTNKARSVMDIYQQRAEYEARMKVERIKRDLDVKEFLENEEIPEYTRNVKLVNRRNFTKGQQNDRKPFSELTKDYFDRSKHLLESYYSNAFIRDRLSNVSDDMVIFNIKETPNRIKKKSKTILKKLDKYNISLGENGEPDFSNCTNDNIKNKFQKNPWVKYALLQREMDYSFPHLEHQRQKAEKLKKNVFSTKNRFKTLYDSIEKEKNEESLKHGETQTRNDKTMKFDPVKGTKIEEIEDEKAFLTSPLSSEAVIHGESFRLDKRDTLLESFDERILRLEKKWFGERLASLNRGVEQLSEEEMKKKSQDLLEKIRRIKLKVEQEAIKKGEERYFDEHKSLTEDEIMIESVPLERLINYYKLPKDERQSNPKDDYEFVKSLRYVRRQELVEDLYDPTTIDQDSELTISDSLYYERIRQDELLVVNEKRRKKEEYDIMQNEIQQQQIDNYKGNQTNRNVRASTSREDDGEESQLLIKFLKQKLSNG